MTWQQPWPPSRLSLLQRRRRALSQQTSSRALCLTWLYVTPPWRTSM